jgi:hypothetical protein
MSEAIRDASGYAILAIWDELVRQYAWLDGAAALGLLKDEGWTITGPHPKRLSTKQNPPQWIYAQAMMRTIH